MSAANDIFVKVEFDDFVINKVVPTKIYLWRDDKHNVLEFLPRDTMIEQIHLNLFNDLKSYKVTPLIKQKDEIVFYREYLEKDIPASSLDHKAYVNKLNKMLVDALTSDDFLPIIEFIRNRFGHIDLHISYQASLLNKLSQKLLLEDNNLSRTVTLCYILENNLNETSIEQCPSFYNMMNAVYLSDLGFLYLDQSLHQIPNNEFTESHFKEFSKHPEISAFLIKKLDPHISSDVLSLIMDQHEHPSGTGFPGGKKNDFVRDETNNMNFVKYMIDFSEGKINDSKIYLLKLFGSLAKNELPKGFKFEVLPQNLNFVKRIVQDFSDSQN